MNELSVDELIAEITDLKAQLMNSENSEMRLANQLSAQSSIRSLQEKHIEQLIGIIKLMIK